MERHSDFDDMDEPDPMNALTTGGAIALLIMVCIVVPVLSLASGVADLFRRRRNPRRARTFPLWAQTTIATVGIVVFVLSVMVIFSEAQP